ncbi:acidic leucine-rich nuclear phosphoprotein 32 family member A [Tanacetum coccineum]
MAVKNKIAYVGHRRFLRTQHPQRNKFKEYYGSKEPTPKPRKFSELEIQLQISKVLKRRPGKHPDIAKKNPKPNREIELNWSKRSIFWDLEYWPFLKLKHNLDVMHIEERAWKALLKTLLQNDPKTKDTVEQIFPPAFFDIMIHVAIHLPDEAILGGPIRYRWMFPFERYMKKLKNYVRNKAKPEGSIAEGYVAEEALTFCSRYLKDDVERDLIAVVESPDIVEYEFSLRGLITIGADSEMYYWSTRRNSESHSISVNRRCGRPTVNDDNPNANEGNAKVMMLHYHTVGMPVVVHPDWPNRPYPVPVPVPYLRIDDGMRSLRRARIDASMLNSLMGETVRYLPLACEWEEIPEAHKAHIFPTLESYFDLASWYNNQDKVVMGNNVYTVGDRVKLGLQLKLRILWRKNKQRIKADHFTRYGSAEEARNHLPPKKVWGDRTEDEWNNLVDWWSHPDRVARSLQNAANRAKNTILTHQGKKSFAQGRNEYKVQKGHYEDLIETWRKTHSRPETGEFKTEKNRKRYLDMKSMQDQVRAGVIPYKTDQDILDEVVPSTNRQNMSGKGRKLPGGGSTSRRRGPQAFPDAISREELDRILRQKDQEAELLRKQTAEAQQRAYLAALKADAAYQNSETMYGAIGEYFSNYAPNPTRPFMPPAFARPTMPQLSPEWAHLLNPPFPYNQPLQPSYAGPSQYTGPPGYTGPPRYTAPLQPLQPPYVGQFPFTPVNNNTFNNCYHPVMNSNLASTSYSQPELPRFITNPHNNDTRSVDELARDKAGEDNDVREDNQQSGGDYSEDEEGDNEEVQDESEESEESD